jgi:hypothetical protein
MLTFDCNQVVSVGKYQELKTIRDIQFPQDRRYVVPDCGFAYAEPVGYLLVF